MTHRAPTRRSDPHTSRQAAQAVTPAIPTIREMVERFAVNVGPSGFTDTAMCRTLKGKGSSLRTRRKELTDDGTILNSGRVEKDGDERDRIVWVHRRYVDDPPPRPAPPPPPVERPSPDEIAHWASQLRQTAKTVRNMGMVGAETICNSAADVLDRLK